MTNSPISASCSSSGPPTTAAAGRGCALRPARCARRPRSPPAARARRPLDAGSRPPTSSSTSGGESRPSSPRRRAQGRRLRARGRASAGLPRGLVAGRSSSRDPPAAALRAYRYAPPSDAGRPGPSPTEEHRIRPPHRPPPPWPSSGLPDGGRGPSRRSSARTCSSAWRRGAGLPGRRRVRGLGRARGRNAVLAGHDLVFLGERGQAKTRMARLLVGLLDPWLPVVRGGELNDDPRADQPGG